MRGKVARAYNSFIRVILRSKAAVTDYDIIVISFRSG